MDDPRHIAEDDLVVLRWSLTGTYRGEFLGIPPTGKTFVFPASTCTGSKTAKSPNTGT